MNEFVAIDIDSNHRNPTELAPRSCDTLRHLHVLAFECCAANERNNAL